MPPKENSGKQVNPGMIDTDYINSHSKFVICFSGTRGGFSFQLYSNSSDYMDFIYNAHYDEGYSIYINYQPLWEVYEL